MAAVASGTRTLAGAAAAVLVLLASAGCAGTPASPGELPAAPVPETAAPVPGDTSGLAAALDRLADELDADFSVALLDNATGETWSYNPHRRFLEASLVKVPILLTLVREATEEQRGLTAEEEVLAARMIEYSDNEATSMLYDSLGGRPELDRTYELIGVTDTAAGEMWGAAETSTQDQLRIIRTAACGADWLDPELLAFAVGLMENVCPEQNWGISAGIDDPGAEVGLKNGWLQDDDAAWNVGSAGFVRTGQKDYSIAVLTGSNATLSEGIDVVEDVAAVVHRAGAAG